MGRLTLLQGGRAPDLATVRQADLDSLRMEALTARAERTIATTRTRDLLRSAMGNLAAGNLLVVATRLAQADKVNEAEATRAMSMAVPECADVKARRVA